jgi:hypothetical protein
MAEYEKGDFVCGTEQGTQREVKGVYLKQMGDVHVVCEVIVRADLHAPQINCDSISNVIDPKQEDPAWRFRAYIIQSDVGVSVSFLRQPACDCQGVGSCPDCKPHFMEKAKGPEYAGVADIVYAVEAGTGRFVTGVVKEFVGQNVVVYELVEGEVTAPEVVCSAITEVLIGIELGPDLMEKAADLQRMLGREVHYRSHLAGLDESELGVAHLPEKEIET